MASGLPSPGAATRQHGVMAHHLAAGKGCARGINHHLLLWAEVFVLCRYVRQ